METGNRLFLEAQSGQTSERKPRATRFETFCCPNRARPKWRGGVPFFLGANKTYIIRATSFPQISHLSLVEGQTGMAHLPFRATWSHPLGDSHTTIGGYNFTLFSRQGLVSLGQGDFSTHKTTAKHRPSRIPVGRTEDEKTVAGCLQDRPDPTPQASFLPDLLLPNFFVVLPST